MLTQKTARLLSRLSEIREFEIISTPPSNGQNEDRRKEKKNS
jgi:hypothetical protein